jgi:hypothetical protein
MSQKKVSATISVTAVIDGQDGVSITSANVFYALSNQGPTGTPPADAAFTYDDFPNGNLQPGYYVWQATVVTFSNGSSEVTGKMCLGATTDFLQGTEVYATSQSGTNPPADGTTNWKTTYTRQKGYYLWTATRVTYTNGTVAYLHKKCVGYWGTDGEDGQDGQDGVSITSANVFYALSNQGPTGTPPADAAFTYDDFPNGSLTPGYYVWQATVVTFSNGNSEVTGKMCLGATTDFLQGTEVYATSQSGTNPPADGTTNWKTTYTRQQGYYLWTATRVTYTNGTVAYLHKKCVGYWGTDGTDGIDGDETPVYSIIPSPAAVNFRSNAVGEFLPSSRSVSALVRKVSPSGSAALSPSNNVIDGKYYLYCYDEESAAWYRFTNGSNYLSEVVFAADALEGTITAVRFALSTASRTGDITANNTVAEAVVPVICDGHRGVQGEQGAQGAMGKMFYPMGEWNATTVYSRTGDLVPLVFLPDPGHYNEAIGAEGNYFYLYDDTSTGTRPSVNDQTGPWRLCNDFGVVITQGLFAEFAKMGKGIFSGDYFFSMNGKIGTTEYRAGATIGGVPAYTRFCGDPSSLAGKVSVPSLSGPVSTDVYTIASVRLQPGVTFRATIVGRRTSSSGTYYFRLRDPNGTIRDSATISSATDVTRTLSYKATTAGTFTLVCYGSNISVAVSFTADYGATGYFEPNWWVDLLTGKMSAARGNFVVDSNGDVHVKSGDVDVSGTIRATNLFHGDCLFQEGGKYSTDWWYVQTVVDTTPAGLSVGDYFTGDFPDPSTNTHDGMLQCTYDADMVMAVPDPSLNWGSSEANKTVVLPLPETFPGKTVEINSTQYGITGSKTFRVGCVGSDRFAHLMVFDGQGRVVRSTTSTLDTLTFAIGGIIRLHSMAAYQNGGYVYYWLDVTGSAN